MPDYNNYKWDNRVVLITEDEEVNFYYLKTIFKKTEAKIIRAKGLLKTEGGNKILQFSSSGLQVEDFKKDLTKSELVLIVKDKDRGFIESSLPHGFVAGSQ